MIRFIATKALPPFACALAASLASGTPALSDSPTPAHTSIGRDRYDDRSNEHAWHARPGLLKALIRQAKGSRRHHDLLAPAQPRFSQDTASHSGNAQQGRIVPAAAPVPRREPSARLIGPAFPNVLHACAQGSPGARDRTAGMLVTPPDDIEPGPCPWAVADRPASGQPRGCRPDPRREAAGCATPREERQLRPRPFGVGQALVTMVEPPNGALRRLERGRAASSPGRPGMAAPPWVDGVMHFERSEP